MSASSLTEPAILEAAVGDKCQLHGGDRPDQHHEKDVVETSAESPTTTDRDGEDDPTAHLERWNSPRVNAFRFCSTNYSMFIMGANDACIGALIPYIEPYYDLDYITVSTLFIVPFLGYLVAGLTNSWFHRTLGQRGVVMLSPVCRLIGYIPMSQHPPFPALPIVLMFAGFGNGLEDSAFNAWVGGMHRANELLGLLHGSYGLGATVSPLVASAMVTKGNLPWYTFYYVMIGMTCVEFCVGSTVFWKATGHAYRQRVKQEGGGEEKNNLMVLRTVLREPVTWLVSIFLVAYVGAEVSLGGWIPTFMLRVRHAEPFLAGLTVTFFWLGLTLGRVILGFVTGRIGEKLAITVYLLLAIVLEVLYWLVPNFVASVVFVILLGFFLGPLFPAAIVAATKLLPAEYHVGAIGFAAAVGGGGMAILPFAVGAIAQKEGVQVLQPIIVALLAFLVAVWMTLPGGMKKGGLERARDNKEKFGSDFKTAFYWATRRKPSS